MLNNLLSSYILGWGFGIQEYLLIIVVLIILFLLRKILASRGSAVSQAQPFKSTPPKPIVWFIALSIGIVTILAMFIFNHGSETSFNLARTATLITASVIIFKSRKMFWWYSTIAGLGIGIILLTILLPSMLEAQKRVELSKRSKILSPLIIDCANLSMSIPSSNKSASKEPITHDAPQYPVEVRNEAQFVRGLPELVNNLTVFKALNLEKVPLILEPHPCEFYLPPRFLAHNVSDVRVVVIVGPVLKETNPDIGALFWHFNMPVLVFKWPEQILLSSTKIKTDKNLEFYRPRDRHVLDKVVADNLVKLLTIASSESREK